MPLSGQGQPYSRDCKPHWCLLQIATYAVATGTICLAVFRGLSGMPFGAIWTFSESLAELDYRHVLLGESCRPADPTARYPCQLQRCGLKLSNLHCKSTGSHPAVLSSRNSILTSDRAQPDADVLAASCRARHGCGGRGTGADLHAHPQDHPQAHTCCGPPCECTSDCVTAAALQPGHANLGHDMPRSSRALAMCWLPLFDHAPCC